MNSIKETVVAALLLVAAYAAISHCAGCAPAAEAAYTADLLRCVDRAATLAESRECRKHVDGNYGITSTGRDAGR